MIEFTKQDKLALASWLASDEMKKTAMSFAQLEGFLFALVAAPSPIIEDVWVKQALGDKSAELADDKLFALMAFHNDVSEQVFEQGYNLPSRIEILSPSKENLASSADLHCWAHGFTLGVAHYIEPIVSSEQLNPELSEALAMALGYLCFFADLSNDSNLCDDVLDLIASFAEGYAELIEACVLDAGLVVDEDEDELDY